jgi:hypothetical protein
MFSNDVSGQNITQLLFKSLEEKQYNELKKSAIMVFISSIIFGGKKVLKFFAE